MRRRNAVYVGLIAGLLAVVIIGLLPGDSAPETPAERSHRLASALRCPFCNGESIADAQSTIGADLRDLIDEQVAAGMTDDEIIDFYVALYTERVLLSPPLFGWGLVLWALPAVALIAGAVALGRRKRGGEVAVPVASVAALEDARRAVSLDLAELDTQEVSGEIDAAAATRLRTAYEAEQDALADTAVRTSEPQLRSKARTYTGAAVLIVGGLALAVAVTVTVRDRAPGDLITGGIAAPTEQIDLAAVTNEQMEEVIANNPDVVPMRLALAGRYFDEGDFSAALEHYLQVLDREQHPEALANIGWMTYLSGEVDTGLQFVQRSLDVTTELPQAHWYLANIRYRGLADAAGAVGPLETLLEFAGLPDEVRAAANELLVEVRAAL